MKNTDHPHTRYVREFCARRDWAALCRYATAHQYDPAFDSAIAILRGAKKLPRGSQSILKHILRKWESPSQDEAPWPQLSDIADYLVDLRTTFSGVPNDIHLETGNALAPSERATVRLAELSHVAVFCDWALHAPIGQQQSLLRKGIQAADEGCEEARRLGDIALESWFLGLRGRGLSAEGKREEAIPVLTQAVGGYAKLSEKCPQIYRPHLAFAYHNLGMEQAKDEVDLTAAHASYLQALRILQECAESYDKIYFDNVAVTLIALGHVERHLKKPQSAHDRLQEALRIVNKPAHRQTPAGNRTLAQALHVLANVQADLQQFDPARKSLQRCVEICCKVPQDAQFLPLLAEALNDFGAFECIAHNPSAAEKYFLDAVAVYRALAQGGESSLYSSLLAKGWIKAPYFTKRHFIPYLKMFPAWNVRPVPPQCLLRQRLWYQTMCQA